jgi:hypothetical protein
MGGIRTHRGLEVSEGIAHFLDEWACEVVVGGSNADFLQSDLRL